ncbi:biotin--[acetyl-CoA-carboxylase] ligase [Trinickia sp. LjRoot230]|uniref:biotin--[acetyl-CoA-carboxylase] ligase n=1 Tax=Trinickia sp. LjRoot230 TaxID=3342288 RepID=UPI003ECCE8D8
MTDTSFFAPAPTGPARAAIADDWRIDGARALASAPGIDVSKLEIVDETGSTNTDLVQRMKALSRENPAPGVHAVRVAYLQTAGRGRQGRTWHAQAGDALMFSLACIVPRPVAGLAGLSLAVGTVLVERLRTLAGLGERDAARIALKWPNDLLLDGGKLAGILTETAWSTASDTAVVIGIGINVRRNEALERELAAAIAKATVSTPALALARPTAPAALAQVVPAANLTDTLAAALAGVSSALDEFAVAGFAAFRARWSTYHAYAERDVVLLEHGIPLASGRALGVDEKGQLLLATDAGVQAIATGDVSLRLASAMSTSSDSTASSSTSPP